MIPPSMLFLRINRVALWLPLFLLLWPLLILAAPFVLVASLFSPRPGEALRTSYALVCSLRGLDVNVDQPGQRVSIKFI